MHISNNYFNLSIFFYCRIGSFRFLRSVGLNSTAFNSLMIDQTLHKSLAFFWCNSIFRWHIHVIHMDSTKGKNIIWKQLFSWLRPVCFCCKHISIVFRTTLQIWSLLFVHNTYADRAGPTAALDITNKTTNRFMPIKHDRIHHIQRIYAMKTASEWFFSFGSIFP